MAPIHRKRSPAKKITRAPKAKRLSLSAKLRAHSKKPAAKLVIPATAPKIHPELLHRHHGNPIIEPRQHVTWESKATFNPGAVEIGGKVHLMYRAIGDDDISVIGHAVSYDGITIHERSDRPAYIPDHAIDLKDRIRVHRPTGAYLSGGGGWGGSEDPRVTMIDDRVYLTYTAFDGWGSVRVALSSIAKDDFLREEWLWNKPTYLSPAGEMHKNWVLFPEKIKGKFAVMHSVSPDILVEYVDDLDEFGRQERSISSYYSRHSGTGAWDSWVRGIGPPPIKTKDGWLLLYHAMDVRDPNRYKLGAMLVDAEEPTRVLCRSRFPVLEPEEWYENTGWKSGVVYACGAVMRENTLFVYYGGADSVVCVATADINQFLEQLKKEGSAKLTPGPKAKPLKIDNTLIS